MCHYWLTAVRDAVLVLDESLDMPPGAAVRAAAQEERNMKWRERKARMEGGVESGCAEAHGRVVEDGEQQNEEEHGQVEQE